jgi:hypothetical protein
LVMGKLNVAVYTGSSQEVGDSARIYPDEAC